jgi:hypothetical protein
VLSERNKGKRLFIELVKQTATDQEPKMPARHRARRGAQWVRRQRTTQIPINRKPKAQ